jgi:choline-sulfatase
MYEVLCAAFLDRQRAVCTARWKLIRTPAEKQIQLFDVEQDPWEMRNLAGDPEHAATVAMLDAKLRELMRELKDPMAPEKLFGGLPPSSASPTGKGPRR